MRGFSEDMVGVRGVQYPAPASQLNRDFRLAFKVDLEKPLPILDKECEPSVLIVAVETQ